jgi:hypothetical protein
MATAIESATVQIRTLSVGSKTMTQGIYRQLRELSVINAAGRTDGTPWGTVNHHTADCNPDEHIHVVWQMGDELRKDYVRSPLDARFEHPMANQYVMALIAEGAGRCDINSPLRLFRSDDVRDGARARVFVEGMLFLARVPRDFLSAWERGYADFDELNAKAIEHYETALRPTGEIAEQLPIESYKASWRALNQLPQLFIGR